MTEEGKGGLSGRYVRLSTGLKMFLILSFGLLPLGLIAILTSIHSARQNADERRAETLTRLEIKAQRINAVLSRSVLTIGTASAAIAASPAGSPVCTDTLRRLEGGQAPARYALYSGTRLGCASTGFVPPADLAPPAGQRASVEILPGGEALRLVVFSESGRPEGVAEFSRQALSQLTYIRGTSPGFDLTLSQGERRMVLRDRYEEGTLVQTVQGSEPVAGGRMTLSITLSMPPMTAAELLTIALPILMWLLAAVIGWFIVDRFLLRPLSRMQQAVSAYRPGDRQLDLPSIASPAREIAELGEAFDQVTRTVARHEAELEAAVERQTRLVREVHHRVKNNLQVVASLLNIHSRGSTNEDVAAAYASIQRRVDALAVVHRNHYAELEENKGVALKALISELASNLRGTAPKSAQRMVISLNLEPLYVNQDVGVSVAFLVTEMVEFAMFAGASSVAISLESTGAAVARLAVTSEGFKEGTVSEPQLFERFERIVTGLSRQLRSPLERDLERGRYALDIAIAARADS